MAFFLGYGAPNSDLFFFLLCMCGVASASHGTAMAARRCKGLMLATAALAALLAAFRNRCVCCDAFITPSFRSSAAAAAVSPGPAGRLIRHRRSAAAPADADADEDTAPGATLDASKEAAISEGGSLDVENVVVIGRCAEDLNVALHVFSCHHVWYAVSTCHPPAAYIYDDTIGLV